MVLLDKNTKGVGRTLERRREAVKKNGSKINRTKTILSEITFKNELKEIGNDHNLRPTDQLISKIERFNYLGSAVHENG